ncbi:orotate phosphoribosyltransferase [Acidiferrobacter sp.]|uniref:orotate phosphoribosyltransferase n=1 Tax=Acidiferrobacter sp. TaxID=1872107 RepID=UPI0026357BF0|nr:orotate phosphoribosyltransferase [Acidiferrobacter sp.]
MSEGQDAFFDLAVSCGALRFGTFTLKSGRQSPYFFNAAAFASGRALTELGRLYARAVETQGLDYDMIFGPAYKGIPLAVALASGVALEYGRDLPYCFNRKEAKDHGEGGITVGAPLRGRVLVVDDVISAGTSIAESAKIIADAGATLAGIVIALDREERGSGAQSASAEVMARHHVPVVSLGQLSGLLAYLGRRKDLGQYQEAIAHYRARYGAGLEGQRA